jgi:hypothetical protein
MREKTTPLLIDNEFVSLRFHAESRIVHHQLKKFIPGSDFRELLSTGLELMIKHGAKKWLSDDRGYTVLKKEDSEWAIQVWSPRMVAAGWRYWAIVIPNDPIGQLSLRRFLRTYQERNVTGEIFTEPDAALTWLEAQR